MKADLTGRVAFVTGAANGIGRAIARTYADNGAAVVVADIDGEAAFRTAASLPRAIAAEMDIRDESAVAAGVAAAMAAFGRIDVLVNNAGVNTLAHRVPVDAFPVAEWHRIVSVDLDGTFLVSRTVLPAIIAGAAGGRIINIASTVGIAAMRLQSPFVAAKAAIIHLTRSMALELAPHGILVNAIAPGSTLTEITRKLFYGEDGSFHDRAAAFMRHIPMGRPGTPEEIAQGALFLAAPASSYVNGHCLTIDGGWTAGYML
jgi:3-oxoacyl-[acyl-carrier protein] reductase/2-deoxy-D-gluconate 3-dehydrogenase